MANDEKLPREYEGMGAKEILHAAAAETGWTDETMVDVACRFIDEIGEGFFAFGVMVRDMVAVETGKATWSGHRCPNCNSVALAVVASLWVGVTEGGTEAYHDSCPDSDHDWDDDSEMRCAECGCTASASNFIVRENK